MAQIEPLWHQDFRQNLTYYGYSSTDDDLNFYTGPSAQMMLCPEPEKLYYMPIASATGNSIVDFSDDHQNAKKLFRTLLDELARSGKIKQVTWTAHRYYWRAKTSTGINLRPGRLDGRPEQPRAVVLNDDMVHGVVVGRTGSGKSVLLNNLLVTLMDEYAPWELSLYIVDMKKVEFGAFMSKGQEAAHVRACAATSEVRYVLSMLRQLERTMQMRQNFFTAVGYKKLAEFRADNPTLVLPRILVVVDEFQQLMLNAVNREQTEILRLISSITRLGRATGVHLLFASQEMSDIGISSLLSNFKLRMALPCDAPVSSNILGNSAAADLEKGFVLVNCSGGDVEQNMRFQVPFVDSSKEPEPGESLTWENTYLHGHLQYVRNRARKAGFLQNYIQKFYQEDQQYDIHFFEQTVLPRIQDSRMRMNQSDKFLETLALGDGVLYTDSPVDLESLCIERGKNQNIFAVASDAEDLVYLQKLMVDNLATSPHTTRLQGSGVSLDYFSFDPVVASYYDIKKDELLSEAGISVSVKDDSHLPELICDLHLRKILFHRLTESRLSLTDFFTCASNELIQAINDSQIKDRERKLPEYDTTVMVQIQKNLLKELTALTNPDADVIEAFCQSRCLRIDDIPEEPEASGVRKPSYSYQRPNISLNIEQKFGAAALSGTAAKTASPTVPPAPKHGGAAEAATISSPQRRLQDIDSKKCAAANVSLQRLKEILHHYALTLRGVPVQQQFPLKAVMMSNANLSEVLNASTVKRNDIRILHESLLPLAPTYQVLFIYFFSEADNLSLRSAFNYFFVCGNREKDYDYCRMRYTKKAPGSIVVDCHIHSKNVDRSFKKFRWTLAEPEAESLDLSNLFGLYADDAKGTSAYPEEEEENVVPAPIPKEKKLENSNDIFFFL